MKRTAILIAWSMISAVIIYCVLVPENAVMFQNPMAAMSLGVIGLGLCMKSKKQGTPHPVTPQRAGASDKFTSR